MDDSFKLKFHLLDGKGKPCGVFDDAILRYIKENYNLFFIAGTPYHYTDGVYRADFSGAKLKTLIKSLILPRFVKSTTITRIYQLFAMDFELEKRYEEINQYPVQWIPFKNCFLDSKTGETYEHKPEYYCINQIPWNYEPDREYCGIETEKFFKSAMSTEDRKTIFQYLGLCMTRCNFQKFIILKGSRGTGKSVIVRLFENVIGAGNYSNIPLQKLEEKFYSIQLLGKLVNLCADLNGNPLKTVNTIKLITGGDSISDSYKGRDIITFVPYDAQRNANNSAWNIQSAFSNLYIPLPHIDWSWNNIDFGAFSFSIPSFSINWYKTGGLFTKATVAGIGEAGNEAVLPLENRRTMSMIANSILDNATGDMGLSKEEMRQAVTEGVVMAMMNNSQNQQPITVYAELKTESDEVLARAVTRGQKKIDYRMNPVGQF